MIKGKKTIDGTPIEECSLHSHKRVIKICDHCGVEVETAIREIYKSRKRTAHGTDACKKCSLKLSGKLRRKGGMLRGDGYYADYDVGGKIRFVHRQIMEKHIGRKLNKSDIVHHIDNDKINNNIDNLYLTTASEHKTIHSSMENVGFELYKKGLISFCKQTGKYFLNNTMVLERSLGFDKVAIKQKKNICQSRLDAKIRSEIIKGVEINVPLIASNMSTVVNSDFYNKMFEFGGFAFLHRAQNIQDYLYELEKIQHNKWRAVSIGITDKDVLLCNNLVKHGANVVLIDIAHGYSDHIVNFAKNIKKQHKHVKLVLGNTTNVDLLKETHEFVDAIKVGIAQGLACETKNTAGCTEKQFSAVLKFKTLSKKLNVPVISDGGTREPADFVKAIAAGANSVMAGSIFARCPESAAEIEFINDIPKKIYAGMASRYVQEKWKGGLKKGTCPEGKVVYLDIGESLGKLIERYSGALRSGITYAGGMDIETFQNNVEFVELV